MTSYQFKCGIFDEECEKVSFAQALFFWSDNDVVKLIHKIEKFHPQVKKPLVYIYRKWTFIFLKVGFVRLSFKFEPILSN